MGKKYLITFAVLLFFISIGLCVLKPDMHKPFSVNIIDYFIKIKDNGQMETIKTITSTTIEQKEE